jgi:hypothetical protein
MKFYNKDGRCAEVDKEQVEAVEAAGWTRTKPEKKKVVPETPKEEETPKKEVEDSEEKPKPKKVRKINLPK